jgi:DNA-directed RNA polymerase subunit N (RpoN/RPB10)
LETRKDGTKFTNRGLKDAAERLNAAAAKYEALQKDLVAQVMGDSRVHRGGGKGVVTAGYGCDQVCCRRALVQHVLVGGMPVSRSTVARLI